MDYNIKVPSSFPRVLTALQFGVMITVFFEIIFYVMGLLVHENTFSNPLLLLVTFILGVICVSPFFYTSDKRLGLDELRKGMYTVDEATIIDFNDKNMLLKVGQKNIAVSNPLLFNIELKDLQTKDSKVLYIKTQRGHEFITCK